MASLRNWFSALGLALVVGLTACARPPVATQPPAATPADDVVPTASVEPTPAATSMSSLSADPSAPASAPSEPPASDPGPAFACSFDAAGAGDAAGISNLLDVRTGEHADYDRLVFEFSAGVPQWRIERADPPFTADGSGQPVEVAGDSFARLTLIGATKMTESGDSSYDGSTNLDRPVPMIVQLRETGDFEAQSTWIIGMRGEPCMRAFALSQPARLVIDLAH